MFGVTRTKCESCGSWSDDSEKLSWYRTVLMRIEQILKHGRFLTQPEAMKARVDEIILKKMEE